MGGGNRNAARESEFFSSEATMRGGSGSTSGGDCTSNLHSQMCTYSICHTMPLDKYESNFRDCMNPNSADDN